jgi:hypothetical protein
MKPESLIDKTDRFSDWLEQIIQDVIVGSLVVILTITAVHWIGSQMQDGLDSAGRPPIERRR